MTAKVLSILESVKGLSAEERQELLEALSELLAETSDAGIVPDWHLAILEQRLRESDEGADLIPSEEVYEQLTRKLRGSSS